MKISKEQIEDWIEHPVTEEIRKLCEIEFKEIQEVTATDCIFRGEPQKTQENLIELEAREAVWELWIALLGGDWSYFEVDDDE